MNGHLVAGAIEVDDDCTPVVGSEAQDRESEAQDRESEGREIESEGRENRGGRLSLSH